MGDKQTRSWERIVKWALGIMLFVSLVVFAAIPPLIIGDMINRHVEFANVYDPADFGLEALSESPNPISW